jgi:uncharacterized protein YecA (UPF0149 family)
MALDRGTLARIDRRVFTELDHSDGVQVVKVPVSDAVWSTWRRYCDALGITMGQAVAVLISRELATVVGDASDVHVFDHEGASRQRMEQLDNRERELSDRAGQLLKTEKLLKEREARVLRKAAEAAGTRIVTKVGRNEPCPCGSGFKYKRCHGLF